jgi:hypothetical protein
MHAAVEPPNRTSAEDARFLYRVVTGLIAVVSVLIAADAFYFALVRLPLMRSIFADFGTQLPRLTILVIEWAWVTPIVAAVSVIVCVAALVRVNRVLLVLAVVALLLAGGLRWVNRFAVELPMVTLQQSISAE